MTSRSRHAPRLAVLLTLVAAFALMGTAPGAAAAGGHQPRTPIHHLVVMLQQGHSFDNYFGDRAGVAGLPHHVCLRRVHQGACTRPTPLTGSPHLWLRDTARSQRVAVDGGAMDGFVRAQAVHGRDATVAMGHYPQRALPVLRGLADRGAVFDHWFAGLRGSPVANDLFAVAANAPAHVDAVPPGGWGPRPTIFDRLLAAGVPWRVYVEGYRPDVTVRTAGPGELRAGQVARVPLLATPRFLSSSIVQEHVVPLRRYYRDLARGDLPAISFVVTTVHTERPPRNPAIDQRVVRAVANGLLASSAWHSSAFLLSYDTAGGWYDHVAPPFAADGTPMGLRVPTVLLSPYVSPGSVVHDTYDAAAVLGFIEHNWRLRPLSSRDRDAASLLPAFSFGQPPRHPVLVDVKPTGSPVARPDSTVLYAGYLTLLAAAVGCVVGAATWRSTVSGRA